MQMPPPVPVPETPPPGEVDAVTAMAAPAADETPGGGPPRPALPGELDPPLPIEVDPDEAEGDPRIQGELRGDSPATRPQARHIMVLLRKCDMGQTREERLRVAEAIVQRRLSSFNELSISDAGHIITALILASESDQPRDYLRWLVDEGHVMLADRESREADSGVGGE